MLKAVLKDHMLKYSLYFGREGEPMVGYDNQRRKCAHKHIAGPGMRTIFVSVEQLIADFLADVERIRKHD